MDDASLAGLDAAWQAFHLGRNRDGYDTVSVRLRLSAVPFDDARFPQHTGTEFGMQDATGELIPGELIPDGHVRFDVGVVARRVRETAAISFVGPYAHGPAGDQFLYLDWRKPGTGNDWVPRNLRLTALSWDEMIAADRLGHAFAFDATGRIGHTSVPVEWRREKR